MLTIFFCSFFFDKIDIDQEEFLTQVHHLILIQVFDELLFFLLVLSLHMNEIILF